MLSRVLQTSDLICRRIYCRMSSKPSSSLLFLAAAAADSPWLHCGLGRTGSDWTICRSGSSSSGRLPTPTLRSLANWRRRAGCHGPVAGPRNLTPTGIVVVASRPLVVTDLAVNDVVELWWLRDRNEWLKDKRVPVDLSKTGSICPSEAIQQLTIEYLDSRTKRLKTAGTLDTLDASKTYLLRPMNW